MNALQKRAVNKKGNFDGLCVYFALSIKTSLLFNRLCVWIINNFDSLSSVPPSFTFVLFTNDRRRCLPFHYYICATSMRVPYLLYIDYSINSGRCQFEYLYT